MATIFVNILFTKPYFLQKIQPLHKNTKLYTRPPPQKTSTTQETMGTSWTTKTECWSVLDCFSLSFLPMRCQNICQTSIGNHEKREPWVVPRGSWRSSGSHFGTSGASWGANLALREHLGRHFGTHVSSKGPSWLRLGRLGLDFGKLLGMTESARWL